MAEVDNVSAWSQRPVAVIGAGVIGASWTALFLARGFSVQVWDPAPETRTSLEAYLDAFLPSVASNDPAGAKARLRWCSTLDEAVADAHFVQENGPEQLSLKRELFNAMDRAAPPDAVLSSSTSTLTATDIQSACARAGRVLVGHPFNPPHLVPLVEVVGGELTTPAVVTRAMAFYRFVGKHPIRLKREVRGHVANRLQAALWREALSLVKEGIADVADVDAAIVHGPGLRWAAVGPLLGLHLSGGEGGIEALFGKPLWSEIEAIWDELGSVKIDPSLSAIVGKGVREEMGGRDPLSVAQKRDRVMRAILVEVDAVDNNG